MPIEPPRIRRDDFVAQVERGRIELDVEVAQAHPALADVSPSDIDDGDGVLRGDELGALYDRIDERLDGGSRRTIKSPDGRQAIDAVLRLGTTQYQRTNRAMSEAFEGQVERQREEAARAHQDSIMATARRQLERGMLQVELSELNREEAFLRRDLGVLDGMPEDATDEALFAELDARWRPIQEAVGFGARHDGAHLRDARTYFTPELVNEVQAYLDAHPDSRLELGDAASVIVYEGLLSTPLDQPWVSGYGAFGADFAGANANMLVREGYLDRSWAFSPRAFSDFMARSGFEPAAHFRGLPDDGSDHSDDQRAYLEQFAPELARYGWSLPDMPSLYNEVQVNPHFAVQAEIYQSFGDPNGGFFNEQERAYPVEFATAADGVEYVTAALAFRQDEYFVNRGLGAVSEALAEAGVGHYSADELFDDLSPNARAFWTYACYAYPDCAETVMPRVAAMALEGGGGLDAVLDGFDPERLADARGCGIFRAANRSGTQAEATARAAMSEVACLLPSDIGPGLFAEGNRTLEQIAERRAELEARLAELEED
ncbi:MAG: hypothetical protein AAFQ65_03660 [Myxococcota bacterium]